MRNAARWWRAALVVTMLGVAAQARAASSSAPGPTGSGIPQSAQPAVGSSGGPDEAQIVNAPPSTGVPTWYAVSAASRPQPSHRPTLVRRDPGVPSWYAVGLG